jgi:hypothetical protein
MTRMAHCLLQKGNSEQLHAPGEGNTSYPPPEKYVYRIFPFCSLLLICYREKQPYGPKGFYLQVKLT